MEITKEKQEILDFYKDVPTGNIADAMEKLQLRRGGIIGMHRFGCSHAVGFAATMQNCARRTPYDGKSLAKQGSMIDSIAQPGDFVVIATGGMTQCSTSGGLQMRRAKRRGLAGLLTDGSMRDVAEVDALEFPVFCGGVSPYGSPRDLETLTMGQPVEINHVQICPGDLIVADDSGVMVIPADQIMAVAEEIRKVQKKEAKLQELIDAGVSLVEARVEATKYAQMN